jgi:Flp pilus assembly protein TadG
MVELSLVLLPLFALMFGIIDFSMPIFLKSLFTHAVREGARYGVTYRTMSGLSHSESIKRVVQTNAAGFLNGASGLSRIQVKYYNPTTFVEATGAGANADGNIVEVTVSGYQWRWILPIWQSKSPINVGAASADRLESLPRGSTRPAP